MTPQRTLEEFITKEVAQSLDSGLHILVFYLNIHQTISYISDGKLDKRRDLARRVRNGITIGFKDGNT